MSTDVSEIAVAMEALWKSIGGVETVEAVTSQQRRLQTPTKRQMVFARFSGIH
ncbi:hypothetical protein [Paraburkholderia sp. CI3]|uniref:hypothetical protein n=1 Tax=Paraburkholderia sp. CI3 TaxID=2991060 RepID=UPI003D20E294